MSVEEMLSYLMTNVGWINFMMIIMFMANCAAFYMMYKKLNEQKEVIDKLNSKLVRRL